MKVALIAPTPELPQFCQNRPLHLVLSHLLSDEKYARHYQEERSMGSYLILDNSAHEFGESQGIDVLLQRALELDANEVVFPDSLFSGTRTLELTSNALRSVVEVSSIRSMWLQSPPRQIMLVPQGESVYDYSLCLYNLLKTYFKLKKSHPTLFAPSVTLGISKDYNERFEGGLYRLLESRILPRVNDISKDPSVIEIHLLGWVRTLWDLEALRDSFGTRIRSTDSARPFVYALEGIRLRPPEIPQYPGRPKHYFSQSLTSVQQSLALYNSKIFEQTAGYDR